MTQKIVRFCPSPTGFLHVGNARVAVMNYLYSLKIGAKYILRFDDTDSKRSKQEYIDAIQNDLGWLGIKFDAVYYQSQRLDRYKEVLGEFIKLGIVYECFETEEELEFARKRSLSQKKPPIYNRGALKLTDAQKQALKSEGRESYYRFKLAEQEVVFQDEIFGTIKYNTKDISDPVIVRGNGEFLYLLCSVIDDYDMGVSHIIRGADHITNTAVQIQMFQQIAKLYSNNSYQMPTFAHLPLFKAKGGKISKRVGGFAIQDFRANGVEVLTIFNVVSKIGRKDFNTDIKNLDSLVEDFDFANFNTSTAIFDENLVNILNAKIISSYTYQQAKSSIPSYISEDFFNKLKPNITYLKEIQGWWDLVHSTANFKSLISQNDVEFLRSLGNLITNLKTNDWSIIFKNIKENFPNRKGKDLFMPIRLALTGKEHGPELRDLFSLFEWQEIASRFIN